MLKTTTAKYYQVKTGQSVEEIARYFSVSPFLVAKENALSEEPKAGQILRIPEKRGNEYTVQIGDSKALLCGSEKGYEEKNGTSVFYVGMRVRI